jgi:hypothetical protein
MADSGHRGRWAAVAGWTVVLFAAAVVPSPFARRQKWAVVGPDALPHLVGHAGFAAALADALAAGQRGRRAATVLAVGVSAGRLQRRVRGRSAEPGDVTAGLVGAVVGVAGWHCSCRPSCAGRV